jgi:hypothetical protein
MAHEKGSSNEDYISRGEIREKSQINLTRFQIKTFIAQSSFTFKENIFSSFSPSSATFRRR